jgi:2-oxo-4-hydroxy-4-carboxy-5-ureidoimidazoline decarboxylase
MESWQKLDRAPRAEASLMLHACCGSTRWVERMLDRRPYGSHDALVAAARDIWFELTPDDWREAFSHHPRIGDRQSLARRFPSTHHLSSKEQAGVASAGADVLDALAAANEEYIEKFGYIFIVCATGRSADEMLSLLRARLTNPPAIEIHVAAKEQAKITELRLASAAAG